MSESPALLTLRRARTPGAHRLTPIGEVDIATASILERAIEDAINEDGAAMIVVDLTELTFIDSSGIGVLLRVNDACAGRLRIIDGSPAIERLLTLTGVRDMLPIITAADDPLAALE